MNPGAIVEDFDVIKDGRAGMRAAFEDDLRYLDELVALCWRVGRAIHAYVGKRGLPLFKRVTLIPPADCRCYYAVGEGNGASA